MSGFRRARAPAPADLAHHEYYIFMLPVHRGPSTADVAFFSPIFSTRGLFYPCYIDGNLRLRSPTTNSSSRVDVYVYNTTCTRSPLNLYLVIIYCLSDYSSLCFFFNNFLDVAFGIELFPNKKLVVTIQH